MEMKRLKGEAIPVTLEQMEVERERRYAAIAAAYYAGPRDMPSLLVATYAREDIDKAIDKAREQRVHDVLNRKVAA